MASFFNIGEQKVRPGVYYRYENYGTPPVAGADDGRCSAVFRSNWGPVGQVAVLEGYEDIAKVYGDGGEDGTTAVALEQFMGGAKTVHAIRLGTDGTSGSYQILDTSETAVIGLLLTYPGSRRFTVTIRQALESPDTGELLLLDESLVVLEKYTFDISEGVDQIDGLIAAVTENKSAYFTLTKLLDGDGQLKMIDQEAVTPGTDPVINVAAYSMAFEALEPHRWNVLAIDTTNMAVQLVMQMYLNRVYDSGKFVMGVIGADSDTDFNTRLNNASAFNDYQIVYAGNGFVDAAGEVHDGWLAAARIAGLIAGTPSNESITHLTITGATELTEPLTGYQYEQSIKAGMLTFSMSAANTVWVEQGINTLVLPGTKEDNGWKKIKRVKVRFELFQRLNDTVERLVGRVNNNSDGRMTIIQSGNGVCNAMMTESKLLQGAHCEIDPDNSPSGDSAWFLVWADDIDALEKMYFAFKFRFAPGEAIT